MSIAAIRRGGVYLKDAEHHHPHAPQDPVLIRERLLGHLLVSDQLVIGDSQLLNNKALRPWIDAQGVSDVDIPNDWRRDFDTLFHSGVIRAARRQGHTFSSIRLEQEGRGVENVPNAAYAERLDEITDDRVQEYSLAQVTARFRFSTLEAIDALAHRAEPQNAGELSRVREWVAVQRPLNYAQLRHWLLDEDNGVSKRAARQVDEIAGEAYRAALPVTLKVAHSSPTVDHLANLFDLKGTHTDAAAVGMPAWSLAPEVLSRVSSQFFVDLAKMPAVVTFRQTVDELADGEEGPTLEDLQSILGELVEELNLHAVAYLGKGDVDLRRKYWGYRARFTRTAFTVGSATTLDLGGWCASALEVFHGETPSLIVMGMQMAASTIGAVTAAQAILELPRERHQALAAEEDRRKYLTNRSESHLLRRIDAAEDIDQS